MVRKSARRGADVTFNLRVATPKDVRELVRQRHEMFEDMRPRTPEEHSVGDSAYGEWARKKMQEGVLRCYLVETASGEIAGGGSVWLREVQPSPGRPARLTPYLMSVFTDPRFRRMGVASLVVREAERWARGHGYPEITLHASKKGRRVYAKLGWERTWEMRADLASEKPTRRVTAGRARS